MGGREGKEGGGMNGGGRKRRREQGQGGERDNRFSNKFSFKVSQSMITL